MPQDQYLSLDPNAGLDDYLSVDPNAGAEVQAGPKKSVLGFLGNVAADTKDTVAGALSMLNPLNWDDIARSVSANKQAFNERAHGAERQLQAWKDKGRPVDLARLGPEITRVADAAGDLVYNQPVSTAMAGLPLARPRVNLAPVTAGMQRAGTRLVRGAVKPATGEINKMPGVQAAGLDAKSEQIANIALRENVNPLTARGLDTLQQRIDTLSKVRDTDIAAAPQVPIKGSGVRQLTSLRPVTRKYGPSSQTFSEADLAEIGGLRAEMRRNPALTTRAQTKVPRDEHLVDEPFLGGKEPSSLGNTAYGQPTDTVLGPRRMRDLTPNELNTVNKGDNKALTGLMGKERDAAIDARKAVVNQRRNELETVVPGVKDQGKRISELINLRNVANVARKRSEGRDGIGLTDMVALTSGRPETFALTTAMRPAAQAGIGGMLHRTGAALPSEIDLTGLYRLALLNLLSGHESP